MSTDNGNNSPRRKHSKSPTSSLKSSPTQSPFHSAQKLSTKKDGFVPRPYTFKIKGHEVGPDGAVARMPPYWMLIDHTLAVIWCMCSPKHKDTLLGITQLQWALYMLKSVKTRRGDYTVDVKQLIDAIEDRLLDQYAAIAKHSSALLDGANKSKSINTTSFHATRIRKEKPTPKCFVQKRPSRLGSAVADSSAPVAEVDETSPQSAYETPNTYVSSVYLYQTAQEEIVLSSSPALDETVSSPAPDETASSYRDCTQSSGYDDFQSFVESRNENFLSHSVPGRPVSPEYDEVMKRSPPPSVLRQSTARPVPRILFEQDDDDHDHDDHQKEGERLIGDIRSKLPPTVSKEGTMKFLEKMRQDQVKLIRSELTRFQAIEEFMMAIDSNNFHTVLNQSMSRRLEEISRKKLPGEL